MVRWILMGAGLALAATAAPGCLPGTDGDPRRDAGVRGDGMVDPPMTCTVGGPSIVCDGTVERQCNPSTGSEISRRDCADIDQTCAFGVGCRTCQANRFQCAGERGEVLQRCVDKGSGWEDVLTCDLDAGETCNPSTGACSSLCEAAAVSNSYIGCDYWPTPAVNTVYEGFEFAVVIANPQVDREARIEVELEGAPSIEVDPIPPGGLATVRLPWVDALKAPYTDTTERTFHSISVPGAAYHLTSSVPVTVYQFNPLEYRTDGDCPDSGNDQPGDDACFSFSNDASILLPSHVLTGNYIVASMPTHEMECGSDRSSTPGFFSVTATAEGATSVEITFAGDSAASRDGTIEAYRAGDTASFNLQQGSVLQIVSAPNDSCNRVDTDAFVCGLLGTESMHYCEPQAATDLTGSEIRASQPVMVLGGHVCSFVPHNRWACDHLEESVFPLESWGREFIVASTQPLRSEPNRIRIVSGDNDNMITFEPSSVHPATTLQRGEIIEFESSESFQVVGTEALMVNQLLVGQDYAGIGSSGSGGQGDPALSLAIPTEQYRSEYTFLAPTTYETNYVNVVTTTEAPVVWVTPDGTEREVIGFSPLGPDGVRIARVEIEGGTHTLRSTETFGAVVYGFGSYTSYMYPAGLDFEEINIPF